MLFPIHDHNPRLTTPAITLILIALTLLAWFVLQGAGSDLALAGSICELGMIPGELTGRATGTAVPLGPGMVCVVGDRAAWHTVVTSMFLHGGWFHLVSNLWFLWLFGDNVEDAFGRVRFAGFYLVCGIAAALTQFAVDPASPIPMVGASGAISGVMGAYVVLFPRVPVRVVAILVIFLTTFRVPAFVMLGSWFLVQLIGALPQLEETNAGVAFWAHVGGFVAGAVLALTVDRARLKPRTTATPVAPPPA